MRTFVNAIITGIGLKLGADIYKYVKRRFGIPDDDERESVPVESQAQS